MGTSTVTVVGGGVAGMSAACALAEAGWRVRLIERRNYLGGRAASFFHPGVSETIDNSQHVVFGCCTNILGFYQRIGVADQIYWTDTMTMIEPGGRRSKLGPSPLPAPLHALPRFLAAPAFSLKDKFALARAFQALIRPVPNDSSETLGDWLRRHHQTKGALEHFWKLVIASALNADIETIGMPYAAKVIRELFLASATAGRMGMSRVPLSELYAGAARSIQQRGGEIVYNTRVESATWDDSAKRWSIATSRNGAAAEPVVSDYLILAVPFESLGKLLPALPPADGATKLAAQIERHVHWPICSVHLWFDREITTLPHAVLLDREIHWLYNKSHIQPQRRTVAADAQANLHYVELVVSTSRRFAALPQAEAIALATKELAEFFPSVQDARLIKSALIKEQFATFGVPPAIDDARPTPISPWRNCFLAGDWTSTGWPSTMESAARSGHLAAEAATRAVGAPRKFLIPDLKPRGLMRFLG
ncbi:MAG TPA: hydroxysqualene dehydroxylase HpnE [Opitutaceae bacterium]|nr:hydroxysqualene dehydroxylase HpnE [Opitutaceae bacterium]